MNGIVNFTPIDERLSSAGQPTREQLAKIAASGAEVVINLATSQSTSALHNEADIVRNFGMEYIHIPVDWENPTASDLQQFMDAMGSRLTQKVFVHCALNYRASAFVALWRVLRQGTPVDRAFSIQRRIWNLEEYPIWKKFVEDNLGSA
jgi:protein tyrosine phosphatase (PTP) superfamily phosphohydrolase (DUF442 family)